MSNKIEIISNFVAFSPYSIESHFSPRNCTSLQQPILTQELYLENMQQPIFSQELYFSKKKFRLENMHDPILSQELY